MIITGSDWHAVEADDRWEIYNGNRLIDYADNVAIAKAKLLDKFEDEYGVGSESE